MTINMAEGDCYKETDILNPMEIWDSLNQFRLKGTLCDAVLTVGIKKFPVHRAILAANSEYFRALFSNGMRETKMQEIEITGVTPTIMSVILEYLYTRTARLTETNVTQILPQADIFLMSGLSEQCCQFMAGNINDRNALRVLKFAENYLQRDLAQTVREYVLKNFLSVACLSRDFIQLKYDELTSLISCDDLNAKEEEEVFQLVMRWVQHNLKDRKKHLPDLLKNIRFGLIKLDYFVENIGNNSLIESCNESNEIVSEAFEFLYNLEKQATKQVVDLKSPLTRPRIPREVIFVIGGWSGGSPVGFFETYDSRCDRWYTHPLLEDDVPRAYHSLVVLQGCIYMLGGFDGNNYFNSVRRFDPTEKSWREVAPMYSQRCYVSAVACEDYIYAAGGYDGRWRLSSAEKYDPHKNQWSKLPCMHHRRSDAGAAFLNGQMYVAGGFDGDQCLNSVEMYDTANQQWTELANMSSRRSGVGVIAYMNNIYCVGGFDGDSRLKSGARYCPASGKWFPVPNMFTPRSNFAISVMDNMIFVIGGFNGSFTIPQVESFDGETSQWYETTDMNINRSALKAVVLRDLTNVRDFTFHGNKPSSVSKTNLVDKETSD